MRLPLPALALLLLLPACSSSPVPATLPPPAASTSPPAQGDLSAAQLTALLLAPQDLPELGQRRQYARADLGRQAPPQLALCRPATPDAPHATANVIARSGRTGAVQVFEVVSAYAEPAAAQAAFARAVADARACPSYTVAGTSYTVADLAPVDVGPAAQGQHYRLTTPEVVLGDVRALGQKGRFTILISGYGAPPGGQSLLDYQAGVLRKALARLP